MNTSVDDVIASLTRPPCGQVHGFEPQGATAHREYTFALPDSDSIRCATCTGRHLRITESIAPDGDAWYTVQSCKMLYMFNLQDRRTLQVRRSDVAAWLGAAAHDVRANPPWLAMYRVIVMWLYGWPHDSDAVQMFFEMYRPQF